MDKDTFMKACAGKLPSNDRKALLVATLTTEASTIYPHPEIHADIIIRYGCCDRARLFHCVCMYAFNCPDHGVLHIGTHD